MAERKKVTIFANKSNYIWQTNIKTEALLRKLLKSKGYYDDNDVIVEEQKSANKKLDKLLQNASKSGAGKGYPDFIITCGRYPDLVIIVECKWDTKMHASETLDSYKDYAVDGALLYASFLAKEYDVIAIGFSGEKESLYEVSHYIQLNGEREYHHLFNDGELLDIDSYHHGLMQSTYKFNQDFNKLIDYTKEVNEELQVKKIKERLRALLISGILIALKNERFKAEYKNYQTTQLLVTNLFNSITAELEKSDVPDRNKKSLIKGFEFITTNQSINNSTAEGKKYLTDLISNCDSRINGFNVTHKYIDTISQFYVEFLRYANNDKGLGIVLTPPHITELFCELAQIDKDSVVLDNCAGTGGFLVSAMKKMLEDAMTGKLFTNGNCHNCSQIANANVVVATRSTRSTRLNNLIWSDFNSFKSEYLRRLAAATARCREIAFELEKALTEVNPANLMTLSSEHALKTRKDGFADGCPRGNLSAILSAGLGTSVDALLAVKEIVYEKKEMSIAELGDAMAANWKGHEALRLRMLRSKRKWGNDDAEANALGAELADVFAAQLNGKPNSRGGMFIASGHSARQYINFGKKTGATPDGRLAGEEVSKNMSPTMGADTEGATALVNTLASSDVTKLPSDYPLDMMLHPSVCMGDKGLQAMKALVREFHRNGGSVIQFTVFSAEELRDAQAHPEKYENLQVRVCGWNVRWNDLSKAEQDAYIRRAENVMKGW